MRSAAHLVTGMCNVKIHCKYQSISTWSQHVLRYIYIYIYYWYSCRFWSILQAWTVSQGLVVNCHIIPECSYYVKKYSPIRSLLLIGDLLMVMHYKMTVAKLWWWCQSFSVSQLNIIFQLFAGITTWDFCKLL